MILVVLAVGTFLFLTFRRRLDRYAYLKLGEEYERQAALRREWKVGIPYDPRGDRKQTYSQRENG